MKHLFSFAAALGVGIVALLCACQREDRPFQDGLCTLRVCASVPTPTRITGVTQEAESRISSLQVFVFDERGELETSAASSSGPVTLHCRSGVKTVWALANVAVPSSVTSLAQLLALPLDLAELDPGNLPMAGSRTVDVRSDLSETIALERLCAKVSLGPVTKAFTSSVLQAKPLQIRRIYMTNVSARRTLGSTEPLSWCNQLGWQEDGPMVLCDTVNQEAAPTLSQTHTFYVFPNASDASIRGGAWSPRPTRLVIETALDGVTGYYVIDVPGIEANHAYQIVSLTLSRPGAGDEESLTSNETLRFLFRVQPWAEAVSYHEYL